MRAVARRRGAAPWPAVLWSLLVLGLGCQVAPRGWDPQPLAQVASGPLSLSALAWTVPFPAVRATGVELVLCRWPDGAEVPVGLPADLRPGEREATLQVLAALEAALGLRLPPVDGALPGGIELRYPERLAGARPPAMGDTVADCALARKSARGAQPAPQLVRASIHLARERWDRRRGAEPLDAAEHAGLLLHEMGHALGFSGHTGPGQLSVMTTDRRTLARLGEAVLAGEPLALPALRALYAVPSGTVVGDLRLSEAGRVRYESVAAMARRGGWTGPTSRSGDRNARVGWRDDVGAARWLVVDAWARHVRDGSPVEWREPD